MFGLFVSRDARAQTVVRDCAAGEAPAPFDTFTCNSFCTFANNKLTCDTTAICGTGANTSALPGSVSTGFGPDYSAWLECFNWPAMMPVGNACCAVDESSQDEVEVIALKGTADGDELFFTGLQPAHAHPLDSWMEAGDDTCDRSDLLEGSDFSGSDYGEHLDGQAGCDHINGHGGAEMIWGREGRDVIDAGNGADRIDPGDDADITTAGNGNDTVCDTNCGGIGGFLRDLVTTDADNDRIWYADTCSQGDLDPASHANFPLGDECGNDGGWAAWAGCDSVLVAAPATCP